MTASATREASGLAAFASTLLIASERVEQISPAERGQLLLWAAIIIRALRGNAAIPTLPPANGPGDLASGLDAMSATPEVFRTEVMASALRQAADMMMALKLALAETRSADTSSEGCA